MDRLPKVFYKLTSAFGRNVFITRMRSTLIMFYYGIYLPITTVIINNFYNKVH